LFRHQHRRDDQPCRRCEGAAAKTIDIAVTAICAPINMRRASMMSVNAPAGRVSRNIGKVVATCTADTIIGSGLRLVMSQFDEVSNIANPTFDAELAVSMIVNAKLPKTPQRQTLAAGASDWAVDSLDNKIPIGSARNRTANVCRTPGSNGEQRAMFQGAAVRKATPTNGCGCSKSALVGYSHKSNLSRQPARRPLLRWLLVSPKRAATNSTNFASVWQLSSQNSARRCRKKKSLSDVLAMALANGAFGPSYYVRGSAT
jgi:hypothetical protein